MLQEGACFRTLVTGADGMMMTYTRATSQVLLGLNSIHAEAGSCAWLQCALVTWFRHT